MFTDSRDFVWNVEASVTNQISFSYYVGEGPLYWYRIDWAYSPCPENSCASFTPVISYTDTNCPYDVSIPCTKLPADPNCPCDPSCEPGNLCASQMIEVWHMLATSVTHLCERINSECCHKKPMENYYIKRVQQYLRPALCCDVANNAGSDEYVDVDFINCQCGNLVHPCVARFVYPCSINHCGINGDAYNGVDPDPTTIKMLPDIDFGETPITEEVLPMKQLPKLNFVEKFGIFFPEILHFKHNLSKWTDKNFGSIDLFYNKDLEAWYGIEQTSDWKITAVWQPEVDKSKFTLSVDRNKFGKNLRAKVIYSLDGDLNSGLIFDKPNLVLDNIGLKTKNFKLSLKG